jgi:Flp pilus assembly pilin Flp
MDESKQQWDQVGERFTALGKKLSSHAKAAKGAASEAMPDQNAVVEALNGLGKAIDQAVGVAGDAVKDPEIRDGLRNAFNAMGEALNTTFADVGDKVGDKIKSFSKKPDEPS